MHRLTLACSLLLSLQTVPLAGCADRETPDPDDSSDLGYETGDDLEHSPCGEHKPGDTWEPDSCNTCFCNENGAFCTREKCEDEEQPLDVGTPTPESENPHPQ